MPYASKAQARKFHADPKLRKYAAEFDSATDFNHLPDRVRHAKKAIRKHLKRKRHHK